MAKHLRIGRVTHGGSEPSSGGRGIVAARQSEGEARRESERTRFRALAAYWLMGLRCPPGTIPWAHWGDRERLAARGFGR